MSRSRTGTFREVPTTEFGQFLKLHLGKAEMSLADFAKTIKVSRQMAYQYVTGRIIPTPRWIEKHADVINKALGTKTDLNKIIQRDHSQRCLTLLPFGELVRSEVSLSKDALKALAEIENPTVGLAAFLFQSRMKVGISLSYETYKQLIVDFERNQA